MVDEILDDSLPPASRYH